ncbi:hypothetical protein GH984_05470 [Spiribacter sp. C176]|uniref:Uncharacterized protein n=1 Tax=Spiribacter salilacus TaxID=2664894 RepID=A0A6N7QP39_9GAMM|nr:hypothetical protein [Spiribacter salilacus]MRH78151.1 hypothetical protein [Spiribacter salilacus]
MGATRREICRVEYRWREIVITGPMPEAREEANKIIQRFACSAVPYRLASTTEDQVVLKPR